MIVEILIGLSVIILILVILGGFFIFNRNKKIKKDLAKKQIESKNKLYENEILDKLNDRMEYSLSAQNVIEVITGSLNDFIDYSVVSYMLLFPEKIVFKSVLEKSVSQKFVDNIKLKMIDSLSTLLNTDLSNLRIEEILLGQSVNEEFDGQVESFFNIPLVISGKTIGLMAAADVRKNFYKDEEIAALHKITQQATQAVTRLQNAVNYENSKLNAMMASMTDGVVMTDMDNRITVVNPAAKKAVGLENKNDLSMADFMAGLNGKFDLNDKVDESLRMDKGFISNEILLGNNFYKIVVSPVKDKYKTLGCVIVFHDITHEKEMEIIKEDFTSMIVHELRSPLDSIKKITELMRTSDNKKDKRIESLQMIYSSSSDMLELVNNLLDVAKIEAGKFQLTKQKSDIKKIIDSRISFFDIAAKDVKLKLVSCFGKNLPDNVEFDPHTVSEVLNNLISNSLKFTKENGIVTVQALLHKKGESAEVEAKDAGINWFIKKDMADIPDSLLVAVTDNGIGIPADQIGNLFNKFVQVKTTFVQKGGTGLGLAIVKSIIESHGGIVGAESVEGQGTTFYFTLPI